MSDRPVPQTADTPDAGVGEIQLELRLLTMADYDDVSRIMDVVYKDIGGAWEREELAAQLARFPDGQICVVDQGKVVAAALSLIVDYDRFGDTHNYQTITGNGRFTTHTDKGDSLYGVDVFVDPDYRGLRLGRRLYDARKALCEQLNLQRIIFGARMPGYHKWQDSLRPREYIDQVLSKELHDPVLSFQLSNGFHVRRLVRNYMPEDKDSGTYAAILEWTNIYYEASEPQLLTGSRQTVRVGAVQWQMRPQSSLDDLLAQVEFFISSVAGYKADFAVLPEYFNMPLMALEPNHISDARGIRLLASFTQPIVERLCQLAVSYNVNIVAGSMPEYADGILYNVAYLCRRDGSWASQYKLHITPDEKQYWGTQGGDRLAVFDTDVGPVGILVCYDIEFPELARVLGENEVQIIFVPYWVDTRNGYQRVRTCAAARAIENECYVAITGSVGNLPNVENMDIQYSQSAVLSPADFAFPENAVVSEATPNTEMLLISDLDLGLLKELRLKGSVQNRQDRRGDLYQLMWKGPKVERL